MPKIYRSKRELSNLDLLRIRELGFNRPLGYSDNLSRKLYSLFQNPKPNDTPKKIKAEQGGIFNLEFSPDGSILVAACEKKAILLYDSFNRSAINCVPDAHSDCVNYVRFLSSNTIATGSDDNTIKLWDLRFLKNQFRTLYGHLKWVKNIEYSSKENLLVTSAFDGSIYSWDLNNCTENSSIYDRVFMMEGLMRMKLTPDCSKMIISTTSGYFMIIHDLNLSALKYDFEFFRPNIYRLMQISEQTIPVATFFNHLFSQKRKSNRIEFVSDFPNEAEVISSLQVHPMGWCTLTRNISSDEMSEWTCVHDIQERSSSDYLDAYINTDYQKPNSSEEDEGLPSPLDLWMGFLTNQHLRAQRILLSPEQRGLGMRSENMFRIFNSGVLSQEYRNFVPRTLFVNSNGNEERVQIALDDPSAYNNPGRYNSEDDCRIMKNLPRMTNYIEEHVAGKGYIKELCFSADGRVICSPYNKGIRLLSFDECCRELSNCIPDRPAKLHKLLEFNDYHSDVVVSSKFNPRQLMLVSGCLSGEIVWYEPVL